MPRIQGVYKITNVRTTETYIGSSVDITRRWADHRRELRLGIHKIRSCKRLSLATVSEISRLRHWS